MNRRHILSNALRLLAAAACVVTASGCGSELLRTGRAPVMLIIRDVAAASGGEQVGEFATNLRSDVQVIITRTINGVEVGIPTIFNDLVRLNVELVSKDQSGLIVVGGGATTSPLNAVTLTRYRVTFRRSDGRNTPGVDVPFGFDGGLSTTIDVGQTGQIIFDIVRHQAKLDPPLRNLIEFKGLGFISTVAEITLWGRDQNGNEVTATGMLDVQFGDFADPE
jgi:hypothetical protein